MNKGDTITVRCPVTLPNSVQAAEYIRDASCLYAKTHQIVHSDYPVQRMVAQHLSNFSTVNSPLLYILTLPYGIWKLHLLDYLTKLELQLYLKQRVWLVLRLIGVSSSGEMH